MASSAEPPFSLSCLASARLVAIVVVVWSRFKVKLQMSVAAAHALSFFCGYWTHRVAIVELIVPLAVGRIPEAREASLITVPGGLPLLRRRP